MHDVVDLTQELCVIPSITGSEAAVVDAVSARLRSLGAKVSMQRVQHLDEPSVGRDNVLAVSGERAPEILLTTHLDTVPPFIAPRIDVVDGVERLMGRGVIDAKGIAASMICAWQRLLAAGETRVGLLFVVGEETNSDGAKAAADGGFAPHVRFFVNGEPTDGQLVRAMKGVLAFDLDVEGKAAHSAYPAAGKSAVHQLITDLAKLQAEPWHDDSDLGATTLNVGVLEGGVAPNVLAPHAHAVCVMRATTDADVLEARIRALLSPTTTMNVRTKSGPQRLVTLPGETTQVVAFGSDVPHLTPLVGAAEKGALLVGPGSILDAHTSREGIAVSELRASVDAYERLCRRLLAGERNA